MTNPTTVAEAMTQDVVTAEPGETLATVAERMRDHRVGSAVVVERNHPVGIVTERDLLRATAAGAVPETTTVDDWMAGDPECVEPDRPIDQAWRQLSERGYRHIPVVVGDELKGIISMRDLMALAHLRPADEPPRPGARRAQGRGGRPDRARRRPRDRGLLPLPPVRGARPGRDAHLRGRRPPADRRRAPHPRRAGRGRRRAARRSATCPPTVLDALRADRRRRSRTPVAALRTAISLLGRRRGLPASLDLDHDAAAGRRAASHRRGAHAHRRAAPPAQRRRADRAARRPRLRGQLPLHDRRRGARPGSGPGHRAVPDPRHRPRLQRIDVRRPGGHVDRRRPRRGRGRRARRHCRGRSTAARRAGRSTRSTRSAPPTGPTTWVRDAVAQGDRIMGFGHPVYRTADPRSVMLRGVAERHRRRAGRVRRAGRDDRRGHAGRAQAGPGAAHERRVVRRGRDGAVRSPPRPVHAHVRGQPGRRLVRPRPRAARGQPHHPPEQPLHRPPTPAARAGAP